MNSSDVCDILNKVKTTISLYVNKSPAFRTVEDDLFGMVVYLACATGKPYLVKKDECGCGVDDIDSSFAYYLKQKVQTKQRVLNECVVGEFVYKNPRVEDGKVVADISSLEVYDEPLRLRKTLRHWKYISSLTEYTDDADDIASKVSSDRTLSAADKQERIYEACRAQRKVASCLDCIRYKEHCTKGHGNVKYGVEVKKK